MKKDVLEKIENECVSAERMVILMSMAAAHVEHSDHSAVYDFASAAYEALPMLLEKLGDIRTLATGPDLTA